MRLTRREATKAAAAAGAAMLLPLEGRASAATPTAVQAANSSAAPAAALGDLATRMIGKHHAHQISFGALPGDGERFRISGSTAAVRIDGTTTSALTAGLGWYLRNVAGVSIHWDSEQVGLPKRLPAPTTPIEKTAAVAHRLFGNDIWTDYTFPYSGWDQWERAIDVLALYGYNEIFMTVGQEEAAHQTLQQFGYSRSDALAWTPPLAHMNGGLWQAGGWADDVPSGISEQVAQERLALGQQIVARMRDLGLTPVMPGCLGLVPFDFADKNPGAHVIDRGMWFSEHQLSWLDPTTDLYQAYAAGFYAIQQQLFGATTIYAMNPFTEGGTINIPLDVAAKGVNEALQKARPGAIWQMHAWQGNPKPELFTYLDPATTLLALFQADRYSAPDPAADWPGIPYLYGGVVDFGGHTTIGANLSVTNEAFWRLKNTAGSALAGLALSPEADHGDPVPDEFLGELAWHDAPVDLGQWFAGYATRRYGGTDANATAAWQAIAATAYSMPADGWDEAQDSLFNARPALDVSTAATWSPTSMRYDAKAFATALPALLEVDPSLRGSTAYGYDLANVARQVLDNNSRVLLPRINTAYAAGDRDTFQALTTEWLDEMTLVDRLAGTGSGTLLGPWIEQARAAGTTAAEADRFVADARQVLTTWGDEQLSEAGLHDYCNRSWNGLVGDFYRARWSRFFDTLDQALRDGTSPVQVNWWAIESAWVSDTAATYPTAPSGADVHALATDALGAYRRVN